MPMNIHVDCMFRRTRLLSNLVVVINILQRLFVNGCDKIYSRSDIIGRIDFYKMALDPWELDTRRFGRASYSTVQSDINVYDDENNYYLYFDASDASLTGTGTWNIGTNRRIVAYVGTQFEC